MPRNRVENLWYWGRVKAVGKFR